MKCFPSESILTTHVKNYFSGITSDAPMGTSWMGMNFELGDVSQVSVYRDQLWLTTEDRKVYTRQLMDFWLDA